VDDPETLSGSDHRHLFSTELRHHPTLITTNLAFGEWVQVFGDEKLTTALLDRLTHHAEILTTKGSSCRTRKRQATN